MRPLLLTLALVVTSVFTIDAQKFRPGYFITVSGDTVRNDISVQKSRQSITEVVTASGEHLTPLDIIGFGLDEVHYIVRTVSMDKSPASGTVTDTVFLEVMNREKMSLFYTLDENDKAHFYIENESGIHELTVKIMTGNGLISNTRIETFKANLKALFPDCPDLFGQIDKTIFGRKGIQSIYGKLYKCKFGAPPTVNKQDSDAVTELGIMAGMTATKVSFTPLINDLEYPLEFKQKSIDPTGGIFIETRFSRRRMFSLRHEIGFKQYDCTSEIYRFNQYVPNKYIGHVSARLLKYSLIGRVYLSSGAFRPFINGGLSVLYAFEISHSLKKWDTPFDDGIYPLIRETTKVSTGYFGGIGAMYKSFALDLRYEWASGIHPTTSSSSVNTAYVTLSYRILGGK